MELSEERQLAAKDLELLRRLLRDISDVTGADEAIFWKWEPEHNRQLPHAWSTADEARPTFFDVDEWGPLVRWCGEQRLVQLHGGAEWPQFAAAPVEENDRFIGVLTLTSGVGLALPRVASREWLPRYARQIGALLDLCSVRREYGRQVRRTEQLLEAMKRLQEHKRAESLAPAICEHAIAVSSAVAASLIRWLPDEQHGVVQFASQGLGVDRGLLIPVESLVGHACSAGLPLVLEDARMATVAQPLFAPEAPKRHVPSLAIVPLTHDRRVIGAIVIEGAAPGAITEEDAQVVDLLGGSVHGSLEVVWEMEEVSRRAHTDPLTGLWNRRHFDEQLKSALANADRFGNLCSLILVDIDLFKLVNDTHGHEAGDAVLRSVARTLSELVRQGDVCARYGGEEIAILLPQTGVSGAVELAERLRVAVSAKTIRHGGAVVGVTASFGVAGFPEAVVHGDALFPAADRALYRAKADGRNCVRVADLRAVKSTPSGTAG